MDDFTYQYLWDNQSSNPVAAFSSTEPQQPFAKCKQKFGFVFLESLTAFLCHWVNIKDISINPLPALNL